MPVPQNPFPGMNPFFQDSWSDVHTMLVGYIRDALSDELPDDLAARAEERIAVSTRPPSEAYRGDVAVVETWTRGFPPVWQPEQREAGAVALMEPLVFPASEEVERWIEIRTAHGQLVTVIEVLSPANKREDGWMAYRQKQRDFIASGVNLVEIDLLHGGGHVTAIRLDQFTFPPGTRHHVCVTRAMPSGAPRFEVYPCPLREPLPTFRVPLRLGDPDAPLALQPLVDRCYRTGRYWLEDYTRPLAELVAAEDVTWAGERVRAAGLGRREA